MHRERQLAPVFVLSRVCDVRHAAKGPETCGSGALEHAVTEPKLVFLGKFAELGLELSEARTGLPQLELLRSLIDLPDDDVEQVAELAVLPILDKTPQSDREGSLRLHELAFLPLLESDGLRCHRLFFHDLIRLTALRLGCDLALRIRLLDRLGLAGVLCKRVATAAE